MKLKVCGMKNENNILDVAELNQIIWVSFFMKNHHDILIESFQNYQKT